MTQCNIGPLRQQATFCCDISNRCGETAKCLYIKRGKVSVRVRNVRSSVTLGVASSVENDVTMRMTA